MNVVGLVALAVGVTLSVSAGGHDAGPSRSAGDASPIVSPTPTPGAKGAPRAKPAQPTMATPTGNGAGQRIDADRLDGLDSTWFQRRVSGVCAGAVTSVRADGSVACRSLPSLTKVKWDRTARADVAEDVNGVLATFAGGRLVAHCKIEARSPKLTLVIEATGNGGTINGYTTKGSGQENGTESVTTSPTGVGVSKASPATALRLEPAFHSWGRAEVSWWIDTAEGLTHVEAHAFSDQRTDTFANHCTVWTVVT